MAKQDTFFFLALSEDGKQVTFSATFKDDMGDFFTPKVGQLIPQKFQGNRMEDESQRYRVVHIFDWQSHEFLMALTNLEMHMHRDEEGDGTCNNLLGLLNDIVSSTTAALGIPKLRLRRVVGGAVHEKVS